MKTISINKTYNNRRQNGLCAQCGLVKSETPRCDGCRVLNNRRSSQTRAKAKAEGRCQWCGRPKDEASANKAKCSGCAGKDARRAKRKRLLEAGKVNG